MISDSEPTGENPPRLCEADPGAHGQPAPVLARARRLLSSFEADRGLELMRVRVHRRLAATADARRTWVWRPALVLAIVLATSAAAGATVGRAWVVSVWRALIASPTEQHPPPRAAKPTSPDRARALGPAASVDSTPSAQPPRLEPPRVGRAVTRGKSVRVPAAPAAEPATAESTLLLRAITALRRDGDAARAGALVAAYLEGQPEGALLEEALTVALEAAVRRRDPTAVWHARRYLERFPSGRFAAAARHVIAEPR